MAALPLRLVGKLGVSLIDEAIASEVTAHLFSEKTGMNLSFCCLTLSISVVVTGIRRGKDKVENSGAP